MVYFGKLIYGVSSLDRQNLGLPLKTISVNDSCKKGVMWKLSIFLLHRGAFYHNPFLWIYYYCSNKSTGKETDKMHLCAVQWFIDKMPNMMLRKCISAQTPIFLNSHLWLNSFMYMNLVLICFSQYQAGDCCGAWNPSNNGWMLTILDFFSPSLIIYFSKYLSSICFFLYVSTQIYGSS